MRRLSLALTLLAVLAAAALAPAAASARAADDPLLAPPGACRGAENPAAHHRGQRLAMHCLIAFARRAAGRAHLVSSPTLRRSATLKARRIAHCKRFTHHPCGDDLAIPFRRAGRLDGRHVWFVGEDLAWGIAGRELPRPTMAAWLASPPHRAVLLDPRFTHVGVRRRRLSLVDAPSGSVLWVAHFGRYDPL